MTTDNAWTGANFRHGGWLEHERRYERATQFVEAAKALWGSWAPDAVAEGPGADSWARPGSIATVTRETGLVRLRATATLPASRQGRPVLFQAGDSTGGREPAAQHADVVFSANSEYHEAVAYAADLRSRLARYGRSADAPRILPGASVVLGDTPSQIADGWTHYVRTLAVDGFNITPHLVPSSLADIVDRLVPELQERGVYRTEYEGSTLREHLGLPAARSRPDPGSNPG